MMRPPKILLVGREDKTVAECEEPTRHAFLRRLYVFRAARALLFTFGLWVLSQHPLEGKYQTYSSLLGISAYAVSSFVFTCASHVRRFSLVLLGIQELLGIAAFSAVVADLVIDPLLMRCVSASARCMLMSDPNHGLVVRRISAAASRNIGTRMLFLPFALTSDHPDQSCVLSLLSGHHLLRRAVHH